jgi:hypothetical protein
MNLAALSTIAVTAFMTFIFDVDHMRIGPAVELSHTSQTLPARAMPQWGSPPINFPASVMASLVDIEPIPAPPGNKLTPPFKPSDLPGWSQLPTANSRVDIVPPNVIERVSASGRQI